MPSIGDIIRPFGSSGRRFLVTDVRGGVVHCTPCTQDGRPVRTREYGFTAHAASLCRWQVLGNTAAPLPHRAGGASS